MAADALVHDGIALAFKGTRHSRDLRAHPGMSVLIYSQTKLTRDLMDAREGLGLPTVYSAENIQPNDFDGEKANQVAAARSSEESIAPLRSFVVEPIRFGRLFLVGDAAHIVPPTDAKRLNLAASDVHDLQEALAEYFIEDSTSGIDAYADKVLARIWRAARVSW